MDKAQRREDFFRKHAQVAQKYRGKSPSAYVRTMPADKNLFRDKEIVHLRVKDKMTLEYIAEKYKVTRQRVCQILAENGVKGEIIGLKTKKSMAKKLVKMMVSFSEQQNEALQGLMKEDMVDSADRSAFIALLIGAEVKRRAEARDKRGVGRPRKSEEGGGIDSEPEVDYTDDIPKNIPFFGRMIGKREYADIQALQHAFKQGL